MLNRIKTGMTSASAKVYGTAKQAVDTAKNKVGSFNQRVVKPNINAAKDQLTSAKNYLKSRLEDKGSRAKDSDAKADSFAKAPEPAPISSPKDLNCTVESFDKTLETLRKGFESPNPLSPKQAYEQLTALAGNIRDAKELGSVLNLMDDIVKGDASIKDLKGLQDAIIASPLKADAYTLNHVKDYFKGQTKSFSELEPRIQAALREGLSQKQVNQPT